MASATYHIADFFLELRHQGDSVFQRLNEELLPYCCDSVDVADCVLELTPSHGEYEVPLGARLTGYWGSQAHRKFFFNKRIYDQQLDKALIEKDFQNNTVTIHYDTDSSWIATHSRAAVKWLVIKTAEHRGYSYLHASSLVLNGRGIVFAGHSGRGKSSFLLRLLQKGGKAISNDTTLVRENQLTPFSLPTKVRKDFVERFGMQEGRMRLGSSPPSNGIAKGIDLLVFPEIRNSQKSCFAELEKELALERLLAIYEKEASWNAVPLEADVLRERYEPIVNESSCYEFYAGTEEREVCRALDALLEVQE